MSQASCRDVLPARPCSDSSLNSFPCHLYSLMTSAVLRWPVNLPLVLIPEGCCPLQHRCFPCDVCYRHPCSRSLGRRPGTGLSRWQLVHRSGQSGGAYVTIEFTYQPHSLFRAQCHDRLSLPSAFPGSPVVPSATLLWLLGTY